MFCSHFKNNLDKFMYTEECIHFQILKHQFNWYRKRMEISQSSGKKRQNENIFVLLLLVFEEVS